MINDLTENDILAIKKIKEYLKLDEEIKSKWKSLNFLRTKKKEIEKQYFPKKWLETPESKKLMMKKLKEEIKKYANL